MNQKVYIVIDYDDNDRVLLINVDKNMCLKVIKNIIEIDIELGEIDCDIDTIMEDGSWTDYGLAMFEYDFDKGRDYKNDLSADEAGNLLISGFLRIEIQRLKSEVAALNKMNSHLKDDSKLLRKIKGMIQ
ncbi:hypothetical protein ACY2D9_001904 [Listeria monocytogenes]